MAAVASVRAQTAVPGEIIVVIDHNDALHAARWAPRAPDGVVAIANAEQRGLSGRAQQRHRGRHAATSSPSSTTTPWPSPTGSSACSPPTTTRSCSASAARSSRLGRTVAPSCFPDEFDWVVGCTYRGLPDDDRAGPQPDRREHVLAPRASSSAVGAFTHGVGRVGKRPVGCEETELCIRARPRFPEGVILYEPARAGPPPRPRGARATGRYFRARCYAEGLSKALVAQLAGARPRAGLRADLHHAHAPAGVARGVRDALRGDVAGLARAAAIVAGLA